jgi:hypothetical protein
MNAPSAPETTALAVASRQQFDLSPQTFEQALTFSQYLADSDLVPKDFKGRPGNCLIAIQWGAELGLKPMQAMQNLAIINGRPSLWGDAVIALVRGSPLCEYVVETDDGHTATCKVKRRGEPTEQVRTFSMDDAKAAGLQNKQGPWTQYPKRMRQMRARAFALRDVFPDVLRGLPVAEEVMDTPPEKHMGQAEVVTGTQPAAATTGNTLPDWTDAEIDKREPKIREFYGKGKTAEDIIAFYSTKGVLTDAQKKRIHGLKPAANQVQDVAPKVTYAEVADKIAKAQDTDALRAAETLIDAIADPTQRDELIVLAERRDDELAF